MTVTSFRITLGVLLATAAMPAVAYAAAPETAAPETAAEAAPDASYDAADNGDAIVVTASGREQKIAQAPAGLGQRGVGLVLLHSLAGFIQAVIHADIVFLSHFVKRNISFYFFSSHRFKIPHFSTELDFYSIIRN